nr:DUF551 domain-containing protein [Enterobacter hormaechei]
MTFTKERIIEELKASTQNASGMFEISEDTICALMSLLTAPPAPVSVPDEDLLHMAASAIDDLLSNKDRSGAGVWADIPAKLRRAAMLQGADGNSPVNQDGWVACSERMPEETGDIIVVSDGIVMSGVSYSRKKGFYLQALEYDADEPVDDVTHWMPLPAAPQQEVTK